MPGYLPDAASGVKRTWHPLVDGAHRVVLDEIGAVVNAPWSPGGPPPSLQEKQMRYAELRALVEDAEEGRLTPDDWRHVARDPLLWELRMCHDAGSGPRLHVRGYFHEPPSRPLQTVLAKMHVKDVSSGDDVVVKGAQDAQIDEASARLQRCAADKWGLDRSSAFPRP